MTRSHKSALCALLALSCSNGPTATRVMLLIDADSEVRTRTATLDVEIRGGKGPASSWPAAQKQHFTPNHSAKQRWPIELALTPRDGDATRSYEVIATAKDDQQQIVMSARAISGYRAHATLSLLLRLETACLDRPACDDGESCRGGDCVDAHVPIGALPTYERDRNGQAVLAAWWEKIVDDAGGTTMSAISDDAATAPTPGSDAGALRDAAIAAGGDAAAKPTSSPARDGSVEQIPDPPMSEDCPAGQGWDIVDMRCRSCQLAPRCDAVGETGHVLVLRGQSGAGCICETEEDYFTLSDGRSKPCDNDGDGWIVDDAQAAVEGDDEVLRKNARCRVRRVQQIVLRNERGESFRAEDFSAQFGDDSRAIAHGLPLYESARNDGAGIAPPTYGHGVRARPFSPEELNSLTKACTEQQGDFNDDGIADIEEFAGSAPKLKSTRFALSAYYQKYVRFSYFLELHDGWYDDADGTQGYFIQEKPRDLMAEHHVPVVLASNLDSDAKLVSNYAQRCTLHPDGLYLGNAADAQHAPQVASPNTIGGDFAEFTQAAETEPAFHGMTHHAQYKCLLIVSEAEYDTWPDGAASELNDPHLMFPTDVGGELARKDASASLHRYHFTLDDCVLDATDASLPAHGPVRNPSLVGLRCSPSTTSIVDAVAWAAVGYEDYASPYIDATQRGTYQRGCANACLEPIQVETPHDCKQCRPDALGDLGFVADAADLPDDDGNPCTSEQCQGANPTHAAVGAGIACGVGGVCDGQGQCSACLSGQRQCTLDGLSAQHCDAGHWSAPEACTGSVCSGAGACGECAPQAVTCASSTGTKTCDPAGHYGAEVTCTGSVCGSTGKCGVCSPNATQCADDGQTIQTCNADGQWASGANCMYGCAFGDCRLCPIGTRCCTGDEPACDPRPCFVAGTKVTLADGSEKAIERIEVGEYVLAYDTATRALLPARVLERYEHANTRALVVLNGTLVTTPEHRFYVAGEWVAAGELAPTAELTRLNNADQTLLADPLSRTESRFGPVTTYNLEVETLHDYFAGGFLVHNFKAMIP